MSLDEFMAIQRRLLLEQLRVLARSRLGNRLLRGLQPRSVEEFRNSVPLTTYKDYCPELPERDESVLPERPVFWQHTSGRTGEYGSKWVPLTARYCEHLARVLLGLAILSASRQRNMITRLRERPRMVYAVAPRPYTSGTLAHILNRYFPIHSMPELTAAEKMSFEQRIREGFRLALDHGLDGFGGLSLALVAVGERFRAGTTTLSPRKLLARPRSLLRIVTALLKSRLTGQPLMPRHLWSIKGIAGGGTDSVVLREKVREFWGRYPLDTYTCTEGTVIATQVWNYRGMTFVPHLNFLEFIPESESLRARSDNSYRPKTLLLNEVKAGEVYEIVITNFHGGPMTRYRIGDMVRIISLSDDHVGITTPQMVFERRADDLIDLGGFIRLTERTIWQAIENSGIRYVDWVARKHVGERPLLELFIELAPGENASESA
ncbi:MAG: GH3 auxin-responsive promoter family protein, partial [Dehalococcoidia bacterium]|nr:GH3 auxin-responsive promoter family protein [Dehalococcoidia bacterium]